VAVNLISGFAYYFFFHLLYLDLEPIWFEATSFYFYLLVSYVHDPFLVTGHWQLILANLNWENVALSQRATFEATLVSVG
jgi:hypothetical protein